MKALAVWLVAAAVVFAGVAGGYHLFRERNPDRVLVVVDSSFSMGPLWGDVAAELDEIDDRRYAEFALVTEKRLIHTWASSLDLQNIEPYAPRDFSELAKTPRADEFEDASEILFITNASDRETAPFADWEIIDPRR